MILLTVAIARSRRIFRLPTQPLSIHRIIIDLIQLTDGLATTLRLRLLFLFFIEFPIDSVLANFQASLDLVKLFKEAIDIVRETLPFLGEILHKRR